MLSSVCILNLFNGNIAVYVKILGVSLFFSFIIFIILLLSEKIRGSILILISILVIIPGILVVSAFAITGSVLHGSDFRVIFTTDSSESAEFIKQFISFKLVVLILIYIIPLFLFFRVKPTKLLISRSRKIIILLFIFLSVFLVSKNNWNLISRKYFAIDFYKSVYDFKKEQRFDQWRAIRQKLKFTDTVISQLKITKPQTFVVIIGESLSRNHMQIYGYPRETNPKLTAMKDQLYIFNDVVSPTTTTMETMKFVLTLANNQHPEYFFEKRSIVNLFSEAGYDTLWIGNQPFRGNKFNIAHGIIASECKNTIEHADANDQVVVETLDKVLRTGSGKSRIIFIHLRGSHTKYSTRYSPEFSYFDHRKIPIPYGESIPEDDRTIIDEYDNSVRYNDYIISSIIDCVKSKCEYSWVLYFSDHGEELFEYRDLFGHQANNFSRYMCEIPFILWVSDKYKAANRDLFVKMPQYTGRPYSTENVIHSISGLSRLKFDDLDNSKNVFSSNFKEEERLVNKIPYEKVPPVKNLNAVK